MNDQRGHGSAPGGLLELVRPPAVIRHRLAFEKIGIVGAGFIHEQQRYLAVQVHRLVIVPVVLRRFDSKTDKNDWRIDVRRFRLALVVGHKIRQVFCFERFAAGLAETEFRLRESSYSDHRHILIKRAIIPGRLQAVGSKLFRNVVRSKVAAALPRSAPFHFVARQVFHVLADSVLINDGRSCWRRSLLPLRGRALRHFQYPDASESCQENS